MNGRQFLLDALNRKKVARVPVAPFIFNNFINEFYKSPNTDGIEKGIEVYEYFGFDIILRTCNAPEYKSEVLCDSKSWQVNELVEGDEKQWTVITTIKTPEKELTQKKRYNRVTENEVVEAVVEYYIKDEDDFEQFVKYQPSKPRLDCSIVKRARELLGTKGLAAPWAQGAFNSVSLYRKLDDLLLDAYVNPELYHRMISYFSARMLDFISQFAEAGADIVCCGGNIGNATMVGPRFFKEYILPYEISFAKKVKDMGIFYLYHNCGDAGALLDYYSDIKMDIYESLTPPPYGDTILEDALSKIDKNIILCGNIDQIDFLKNASPAEIRKEVRRVLDIVKKRGNFILATTDFFSEGTPYENIAAFAEAAHEYGVY